jgi:hypothetical protein
MIQYQILLIKQNKIIKKYIKTTLTKSGKYIMTTSRFMVNKKQTKNKKQKKKRKKHTDTKQNLFVNITSLGNTWRDVIIQSINLSDYLTACRWIDSFIKSPS